MPPLSRPVPLVKGSSEAEEPEATSLEQWAAEWQGLSAEASQLEDEIRALLRRKPQRRPPSAGAEDAAETPKGSNREASPSPRSMRARWPPKPGTQELEVLLHEADAERGRWEDAFWGTLTRLRKRVTALGLNGAHNCNPEQLRTLAKGLEHEFEAFKASQRQDYDTMAASKPGLEDNLHGLAQRFEGWAQEAPALARSSSCGAPASTGEGQSQSSQRRSRSADVERGGRGADADGPAEEDSVVEEIKAELNALELEVQRTGGTWGGWSQFHHEDFMRIYRIFKNQATPAFYHQMSVRFPDTSEADIAAHVQWCAESGDRQAKKRQLLVRWRDRRAELARQAAEAARERDARSLCQDRQAREREWIQRDLKMQKVSEWRQLKEEEAERAAALARATAENKARLEREQQRSKRRLMRGVNEVLKSKRELERQQAEAELLALKQAEACRRALSEDDRRRIAHRNVELLKRKLQAQPPTPSSSAMGEKPLPNPAYAHVDSRLHNSTQCFLQRVASRHQSEGEEPEPPKAAPEQAGRRSRPQSAGSARSPTQ